MHLLALKNYRKHVLESLGLRSSSTSVVSLCACSNLPCRCKVQMNRNADANCISNGLRPLPPAPWIVDLGRSGQFFFARSRQILDDLFFEGYGWIRTKKLVWTLPFSRQMARTLSISCPSSFPNLAFWPISGLSKISTTS